MSNWKEIWNKKGENVDVEKLQDLINANGYETSGLNEFNLTKFINEQIQFLGIKQWNSVYEVGCGAGTILSLFNKYGSVVGGCDYSKSLTKIAKSLKISNDIECLSADKISSDIKYDFVISMGVFHYFPNLDYVTTVTELMLEKANKEIAIFDLNDESKKELYYEIRRSHEPDYDKKYAGIEHLFIDRQFWIDFAKNRDLKVIIEDQQIEGYKNEKFRYNVYLKK